MVDSTAISKKNISYEWSRSEWLSEEIKKDLQYRQRDLGIKPEDVVRIEQLILAEGASLDKEEAQAMQSQEAERARQQDLQAQHASEEAAQARERAREAHRDRE